MSTRETDIIKGLKIFTSSAPEALAEERVYLEELKKVSALKRWKAFWSKTGPGWMQSAMTIGGATAMTSIFTGRFYQYKLLWIQPLAMIIGIVMISALSYQILCTGKRPFLAVKRYVHPVMGWSWVIASLLSTIIWHFPMYALVSGMTDDIIKAVSGWKPAPITQNIILLGLGILFLIIATSICWNYSKGREGIRRFEKILKTMVWLIIFCFLFVVIRKSIEGGIAWSEVAKGFLPIFIPTDQRGVTVLMAAYSATVGINMTFLFGYSYLARGWGKEHNSLARFDLVTGMLLPFIIATSLMIIATGSTIYEPTQLLEGTTKLSPMQAAAMIEATGIPLFFSRIIFGFGIIGMALNAIILHMLVCGFAVCEVLGIEPGGKKYKIACLTPSIGFLGSILWKSIGPWIAIPTSAVCGIMLPIAYISFFILNNSKEYLEENKPKGAGAVIWNIAMLIAIGVSICSVIYFLYSLF